MVKFIQTHFLRLFLVLVIVMVVTFQLKQEKQDPQVKLDPFSVESIGSGTENGLDHIDNPLQSNLPPGFKEPPVIELPEPSPDIEKSIQETDALIAEAESLIQNLNIPTSSQTELPQVTKDNIQALRAEIDAVKGEIQ